MKILLVIPYFMPAISYGGPVKVAYELAKGLAARGHEVTVATTDAFDAVSRCGKPEEIMEGIRVLRFRNLSNRLAKRYNAYLPGRFFPWLVNNCRRFDLIHCHDFFSLPTLAAGWLCHRRAIPLILQPHGSLSAPRRSARFTALKRLFLFLGRRTLGQAAGIVALTAEEKAGITALAPALAAKIVVIPNGLDPGEFAGIEKIDLRARYGIPPTDRIIGFIGRLAPVKGLDISLEVLALLKKRLAFSFLVIGPDEGELARLKGQAERLGLAERVIFAGTLGGEEKLRVMKSCDLFLFTSRDEGLPLSILEVAALGLPQVASRECHVPELAEYRAGYLYPLADLAGFVAGIEALLADEKQRLTMADNARSLVRERFSKEKMVERVEQLMIRSLAEVRTGTAFGRSDSKGREGR